MSKKQIKDIWGWLNEITLYKTPIENISEESWDKWNSYMVNRYVSMDIRYIEFKPFPTITNNKYIKFIER